MGKKRIKENSEGEVKSDTGAKAHEEKKTGPRSETKAVLRAIAHIQASYNNTRITISDERGNVLAWSSAGSIGFRGTKKSTPYAAARVAESLFEKISRINIPEVIILVRGVGSGRESAIRALANKGLNITMIKDITPIPHNGPRPRKARRV